MMTQRKQLTKKTVDKKWWELDSITLKGGALGKDTTVNNPFNKRPYDAGFSLLTEKK